MSENRTFPVTGKWVPLICLLVMVAVSAVVYPQLPEQVPAHMDLAGNVSTLPRATMVVIMPVAVLLIWLVFIFLPRIDPRRAAYEKFAPSLTRVRNAILIFLAGAHVLLLTAHEDFYQGAKFLLFGAALLLAYVGNEMPRFRQNSFAGIRTPWALADEDVWRKTQRVGGRTLVALGLLNAVVVLVAPISWAITVLLASMLAMTVAVTLYSYLIYRRAHPA